MSWKNNIIDIFSCQHAELEYNANAGAWFLGALSEGYKENETLKSVTNVSHNQRQNVTFLVPLAQTIIDAARYHGFIQIVPKSGSHIKNINISFAEFQVLGDGDEFHKFQSNMSAKILKFSNAIQFFLRNNFYSLLYKAKV